jgi:hypothetical protein
LKENGKLGINEYLRQFRMLVDDISRNGYRHALEPVKLSPIGYQTGAHRVAACIVTRSSMPIALEPDAVPEKYNYSYFARSGTSEDLISQMAVEFIRLKMSQIRVVLLFDVNRYVERRIISEANSANALVWAKPLKLGSREAKLGAVIAAYGLNEWWATGSAKQLEFERFRTGTSRLTCLAFFESGLDDARAFKLKVRELTPCLFFERQIHSSDNEIDSAALLSAFMARQPNLVFEHLYNSTSGGNLNVADMIRGLHFRFRRALGVGLSDWSKMLQPWEVLAVLDDLLVDTPQGQSEGYGNVFRKLVSLSRPLRRFVWLCMISAAKQRDRIKLIFKTLGQ